MVNSSSHYSHLNSNSASCRVRTIQFKFTLINCKVNSLILHSHGYQHGTAGLASEGPEQGRVVGQCPSQKGRVEAAAGRWSLLILHWRTFGLEVKPNTLTRFSGKKYKFGPVQRMWNPYGSCISGVRADSGLGGNPQQDQSALGFLKCYHIWSCSYQKLLFNNQTMRCDKDPPDRPGCLATGSETSVRGRM